MGAGFDDRVRAAQARDASAIASLYEEFHPRLLRYVAARERAVAEDIVGDVWLAVAQALHRFVGDEQQFRAWIFSIARRRLADYRRRAARRNTEPVPDEQLDTESGLDVASDAIERLDADAAVRLVVASLPPEQADVVLLRVLGDLDVNHVAELLGKRPGTVRVLQHRALRRLRQTLAAKAVTQ